MTESEAKLLKKGMFVRYHEGNDHTTEIVTRVCKKYFHTNIVFVHAQDGLPLSKRQKTFFIDASILDYYSIDDSYAIKSQIKDWLNDPS